MADPAAPNRVRMIALAAAGAAVALVVAFALLQKPPPPPAPFQVAMATPPPAPAVAIPSAAPFLSEPAAATPAAQLPAGVTPAWEGTIDGILRSNVPEAQMAQLLINLLPTLPEDGQIEAANHISNLLPDSDYASLRPLLLDTNLPSSVLSVFFTDLMNRNDPTKLNAFLDIAQVPNHPFQAQALSNLQIYVGTDYGTDWDKWKTAVGDYLRNSNQQ